MSTVVQRRGSPIQTVQTLEDHIKNQVPPYRQQEIQRYLQLFGYSAEHSILQVHVAGFFGRTRVSPRQIAQRKRAAERYKGRTFAVLGTSHDPSLISKLKKPRKKTEDSSPGYLGYLFKGSGSTPPHELLPLDFVPSGLIYPEDWKSMFGSKGYLIAMHVPSYFAAKKNDLLRQIRRLRGSVSVKRPWTFLDGLEQYGVDSYEETSQKPNGRSKRCYSSSPAVAE
jgi:hypothetical protein